MNSINVNLVRAMQVFGGPENLCPMKRRETPMDGNGWWHNLEHDNDHVDHVESQCPLAVGQLVNANFQCVFPHGWQHHVVASVGFGLGSHGGTIFVRAQCIAKEMYRGDELNNKASRIRCYRSLISPLRQHRGTVNEQWKKGWMIRGTYWQSMQSTRF